MPPPAGCSDATTFLAYFANMGRYSSLPLASSASALTSMGMSTFFSPFFAISQQPCSKIFFDFGQSYGAVAL